TTRAKLHTCCDVSEATLQRCREQFRPKQTTSDYHAAINDPEVDAICLATTAELRKPIIAAAAEAGKGVYVEKPLGNTMEECYEIQRIVKDAGIPFCIGHNRRSSPAMVEAHRIYREHMTNPTPCPWRLEREGDNRPRLKGDGLGAISVRINDDWHSWKAWAFDETINPHGKILSEMTHFTDICNWFLAAEPEEVFAMKSDLFNASCIVKYATGEMATIMFAMNGTFGYPKELFEVFGHGAAVVIDHMVEVRTAGIE